MESSAGRGKAWVLYLFSILKRDMARIGISISPTHDVSGAQLGVSKSLLQIARDHLLTFTETVSA
jgi:hypothetical protein